MKKIALLVVPGLLFLFSFYQQAAVPDKQLIEPAALAKNLLDPNAEHPVVFNVGPVDQIKGAIRTGPVSTPEGLNELKLKAAALTKSKNIVVYCGCCSSSNCPNIRPALSYLLAAGFTHTKVLNIPTGIKEDWVQKGYPVE